MVMKRPRVSVHDPRYTRLDIKDNYPGFYRARVELTRDPKKMGRVKIRIPHLHGFLPEEGGDEGKYFHTSELPWALPGDFSCAGYDYGQHMVPHVGTFVWVAFEAGDPDKPIYFGGIPYRESDQDKKYGHIDDAPNKINADHPDFMGETYYAGSEGSCPKDVYELDEEERETTEDITRQVVYKSVKGHAIVADDTDEKENFTFIDRVGQMLKFVSPFTKDANKGNKERRELRSSYLEDTIHSDDPESYRGKAVLLLKDMDNQIVRLVAEQDRDKIEIMSRDPELSRNTGATFYSENGDVRYNVVAEDGSNRIVMVGECEGLISDLMIIEGGSVVSHLQLKSDTGMLVETTKSVKLVSNEDVEIDTQKSLKVKADEGIDFDTKGAFNVNADGGINLSTTQGANITGSNSVRLNAGGGNILANNQKVSVSLHPVTGSASGSPADSAKQYVPLGGPPNWADDHDELFILYGDGEGVQGGAGLDNWDTLDGGTGTGGTGETGQDIDYNVGVDSPDGKGECSRCITVTNCADAPRGGLRKSDTYRNNQSWRSEPHRGVDYAGPRGTALTSPVNGVVVFSGYGNSYGNYVIIKEDNANRWHLFAHMMSQCRAKLNSRVSPGTVVGLLSNTGSVYSSTSCGCHVHYEVRTQRNYVRGGGHMNPSQWEGRISS